MLSPDGRPLAGVGFWCTDVDEVVSGSSLGCLHVLKLRLDLDLTRASDLDWVDLGRFGSVEPDLG